MPPFGPDQLTANDVDMVVRYLKNDYLPPPASSTPIKPSHGRQSRFPKGRSLVLPQALRVRSRARDTILDMPDSRDPRSCDFPNWPRIEKTGKKPTIPGIFLELRDSIWLDFASLRSTLDHRGGRIELTRFLSPFSKQKESSTECFPADGESSRKTASPFTLRCNEIEW